MGLSGGLSNHRSTDLLQCLTDVLEVKAPRRADAERPGWPDGRRGFGTVGAAIVGVLSRVDSGMRMRDIHVEVEKTLDGRVSFQSVADYLIRRSSGPHPLFVRTRHVHYRLLR